MISLQKILRRIHQEPPELFSQTLRLKRNFLDSRYKVQLNNILGKDSLISLFICIMFKSTLIISNHNTKNYQD